MISYDKLLKIVNEMIAEMIKQEDEVFVANYLHHLGLTMKEIYYLLDEC